MLAILSTHPIQYQVPIWRALANRGDVPIKVLYMSDHGLRAGFDPGFGRTFAWDIDLLEGYPHEFLDVHIGPRLDRFNWLRLKPGFGRLLREQGVKVLWVQGWQVLAYWQAIHAAHRAGIKVWLRGESNLRSSVGGTGRTLKRHVLKWLLNRVDYFLTIGRANRAFYSMLGYGPEQMVAAPYCVENERFAQESERLRRDRLQIRREWGIPDDAFCFLSVGKFISKKRPMDLVQAVRRLQDEQPNKRFHILWVGTGELDVSLRASCSIRYSPEAGLEPAPPTTGGPPASFAGFLNQSEIARAYVAADALVLPSDAKETWGLVVNEAMASGLPCVVSADCGCAEDLVTPLRPDLCFPMGDIPAVTRALAAVVASPPSRAVLESHIDAYDVHRTVEAAAELYRRCA